MAEVFRDLTLAGWDRCVSQDCGISIRLTTTQSVVV